MNSPWKIRLASALCAAAVIAALSWVTLTTMRLERAQWQAAEQAEIEERVRLALWRMDSLLTPLIVEESARPYSDYESFLSPEQAYTKAYAQLQPGDVLVPSPLLAYSSTNVLVHFQFAPDGPVTSPQAPAGHQRHLAETSYTTSEQIEIATARLDRLRDILNDQSRLEVAAALSRPPSSLPADPVPSASPGPPALNRDLLILETTAVTTEVPTHFPSPIGGMDNAPQQIEQRQRFRNAAEWQFRANFSQQAQQPPGLKQQVASAQTEPDVLRAAEGILKPVWLNDALVLARRVEIGRTFVIQGCWLNWTNLQQTLLESVRDLLPHAEVQPVQEANGEREARMLAALPVKLAPGLSPSPSMPLITPARLSLALAWGCVLIAALAVAVLLHGAVSLSERRGAFVSAVTHELRTPLTTFRLYSEMLADGMVADETQRRSYLATLCSEAARLGHLVENVLAYARLERGSARQRVEKTSLGELLERIQPRLREHAERAGMTLVEDADATARQTIVHVDIAAVEQILFNLVDNACKYALPAATERTIHLEASPAGKFAMLRVRDHGQGISGDGARRLFQPFSKSAHEAAHTAPGIGLGLALCRGLSRSMGGDLRLVGGGEQGACFELRLPLNPPPDATAAWQV